MAAAVGHPVLRLIRVRVGGSRSTGWRPGGGEPRRAGGGLRAVAAPAIAQQTADQSVVVTVGFSRSGTRAVKVIVANGWRRWGSARGAGRR